VASRESCEGYRTALSSRHAPFWFCLCALAPWREILPSAPRLKSIVYRLLSSPSALSAPQREISALLFFVCSVSFVVPSPILLAPCVASRESCEGYRTALSSRHAPFWFCLCALAPWREISVLPSWFSLPCALCASARDPPLLYIRRQMFTVVVQRPAQPLPERDLRSPAE
jgi:hypothetical protein